MEVKCIISDITRAHKELLEQIWCSYRKESEEFNGPVFHYTDAAGLEGILKNRSIWATHAEHVNDPEELNHFIKIVLQQLETKLADNCADVVKKFYKNLKEKIDNDSDSESASAFIASFSRKGDDAHMFCNYASCGRGYCLEFDTAALKACVQNPYRYKIGEITDIPLFEFISQEYSDKEKDEVANQIITGGADKVKNLMDKYPDVNNSHKCTSGSQKSESELIYYHFPSICFKITMRLNHHFKNVDFVREKEFRIVPTPFGDPEHLPLARFKRTRVKDGIFIPYLEIPILCGNIFPLKKIIVGPKLDFEKAKFGIENMPAFQEVKHLYQSNIAIEQSTCSKNT